MHETVWATAWRVVKPLWMVFGFILLFGLMGVWFGLPSAEETGPVKCGDQVMKRTDRCLITPVTDHSGGELTYDGMLARRRTQAAADPGTMAFGGGIVAFDVLLVAGATAVLRRRMRRR